MAFEHAVPDVTADPTTDATGRGPSDSSLVTEVVGGSQLAFTTLYDRHVDAVYAAAMRVSHDMAAPRILRRLHAKTRMAASRNGASSPLTTAVQ